MRSFILIVEAQQKLLQMYGDGADYPYLQAVETSGEDAYTQYASEAVLNREELLQKLREKYNDIEIDFSNEESIKILEYTEGGRVKIIRFGNKELSRS